MKLLDSLREQYTRYQEVCRQRSKRTQLEEIQQKVMQVSWQLFLEYCELEVSVQVLDLFSYKTNNQRWELHASFHSSNCNMLVSLDALHCGYHRDFAKAVLICRGDQKCALLLKNLHVVPSLCTVAVYCLCNAWPVSKQRSVHKPRHIWLQFCLKVGSLPLPMLF